MEFESEFAEREIDKDYFGFEESFIDGDGVRRRVDREYDERESIRFLEEIEKDVVIVKKEGDDPKMNGYENLELSELLEEFAGEEFEFEKAEIELPEEAIEALRRAYKVLLKYRASMSEELKRAMVVITRYIGVKYPEPYPVKKREAVDWLTVRNQLFGELVESEEVEKSDITKDDPFPSISKQINQNIRDIEEVVEENNVEEGEHFL